MKRIGLKFFIKPEIECSKTDQRPTRSISLKTDSVKKIANTAGYYCCVYTLLSSESVFMYLSLCRNFSTKDGVTVWPQPSPFEWVPEQLSRFLTDPTIATLLEHPGQ